jgi:thioredoxin-dependent peroxiredoxin
MAAAPKKNGKKTEKKSTKTTAAKTVKNPVKKAVTKAAPKSAPKAQVKKSIVKAPGKSPRKVAPKATKKSVEKSTATGIGHMPLVGQLAPEFALQSDTAGLVSLSKYRGKNIVLYFYPKDNTPGCTREACSFQENMGKLSSANTVVIGVSPDTVESHQKFRKKFGLEFVLVADEGHKLAEEYGVWVEKKNYGKTYMGVQRATFLIDGHGCVAYVWPKVSVDGHTESVLDALARLSS